jgi:hypothetical protein
MRVISFSLRKHLAPVSLAAFAALLLCLRPNSAPGQTTTTWKGGSGSWSDTTKWTSGVPNGNFNVLIDNGNPLASPVTLDISASIKNVTIDSDDSLGFNDGTALTVNGSSISNAGSMMMNSARSTADLILGGSNFTVSSGGTVTMSSEANRIYGSGSLKIGSY